MNASQTVIFPAWFLLETIAAPPRVVRYFSPLVLLALRYHTGLSSTIRPAASNPRADFSTTTTGVIGPVGFPCFVRYL